MRSHKTTDCRFLGQSKCGICERFGHKTEDCYTTKAKEIKRKRMEGGNKCKRPMKRRREETNEGEEKEDEDYDERVIFTPEEPSEIMFDSEQGQFLNPDNLDANNSSDSEMARDELLVFYHWLADSATTSHVSNRREAFTTFHPLIDTIVSGVGNVKAKAEGRGTVELISSCSGHNYILELRDVLYIPSNRNNLIALGKWDKLGGRYAGGGGALTLITKDGTTVARGTKVENNLYKMEVAIRKPNAP
jgi:hypothetical protein